MVISSPQIADPIDDKEKREIERLKTIQALKHKALKAQNKIDDDTRAFGRILSELIAAGVSKTATAQAFGMTTRRLNILLETAAQTPQDSEDNTGGNEDIHFNDGDDIPSHGEPVYES